MKHLKKIMSLLLTAVMVLAMCIPVMATEGAATPTYTITAPDNDHQYEIYQIFTGDLNNGVLSNVKWGENGKGTKGEAVDEATLNALTAVNVDGKTDAEKLAVIKKYADLTKASVETITKQGSYGAAAGYYLIKDKDNSVSGNDVYTTYIVEVVGNVTIKSKSNVPSFEKKIKDTNDTTGVTSDWQDSADYDIGDQVPFKLEGTVADNYADYKTYYFAFHDVEESGLTFKSDSVKVYVDGSEIKSGYEVVTATTDGCTFEVVFNNLKEITAVKAGSKVTVEYTSELNANAVLGKEGNVNKAQLEFSNNPNKEQTGKPDTGKTPWDNVIVFTYQVVVDKYANSVDGEKLTGAEFTLEKVLENGGKETIRVIKSEDGTSFTFKGLDDGDYILTETKTPDEYNTIDPITFTVTAEHEITWEGEERNTRLTSLTGNQADGKITFTSDKDKGELSTKVVNKKGSTLPTTGGIGTTIFYVVGVILMLGAGVLLVTKKRMNADK